MRRPKFTRSTGVGDPYLPGHGDWSYDVESYDLELDYKVATNRLEGRAGIVVVTACELDRFALDLHGLDVSKVLVDGRRARGFSVRSGRLRVQLDEAVPAGTHLAVSVRYGGSPGPTDSAWGDVGWEELTDGVIVAGQPAGAPSWFPCNDRPSSKAVYRIAVTTESAYTVVANGLQAERVPGASRTTWRFEQPQPMAPYLATVQIGRYEQRVLAERPVPQQISAPASARGDAAIDFGRQSEMLAIFVEAFGPYPFDRYVVVVTEDSLEIPLEAQGLSIFGRNHVDGERGLERLVAHELAHQWFGNSLTAATWSDIWLHEGFACYAEWLWSERSGGRPAAEHARTHRAALADEPEDIVVADPGPDLMFDDRLYKRGALTLQAIREQIGDEPFFRLLRSWADDHRYGNVTTADFIAHARRFGDTDELIDRWIAQPELPRL